MPVSSECDIFSTPGRWDAERRTRTFTKIHDGPEDRRSNQDHQTATTRLHDGRRRDIDAHRLRANGAAEKEQSRYQDFSESNGSLVSALFFLRCWPHTRPTKSMQFSETGSRIQLNGRHHKRTVHPPMPRRLGAPALEGFLKRGLCGEEPSGRAAKNARHAQPIKNPSPPIGVMAPNIVVPLSASA